MRRTKQSTNQYGFTVPELLITLIVATLFIVLFFEMFTTLSSVNAVAKRRALADNTAYSLLRKYSSPDVKLDWFTCDTATGLNNDNDLVVNADAPGTPIESGSLNSGDTGLPGPINYTINALAVYGCAGANSGKPIRIQITLSYGTPVNSITHAILAGY